MANRLATTNRLATKNRLVVEPLAERPQIGAWEPGWWESVKEHILFRPDTGRWTEPAREESVHRKLFGVPEVGLRTLSDVLDRANRIVAGTVEPGMEEVSKRVGVKAPPERKFGESFVSGLEAAVRKPGAPTEAPTYGEAWARSWREPLTGKPARPWEVASQDIALDTLLLFGRAAAKKRAARLALRKPKAVAGGRLEPTGIGEVVAPEAGVPPSGLPVKRELATAAIRDVETPIDKLTRLVGVAKKAEKVQESIRKAEFRKTATAHARALKTGKGEQAFWAAKGKLKGRRYAGQLEPFRDQFTPAEYNALVEQLRGSNKLLPLEKTHAFGGQDAKGFWGLVNQGDIPQRHQIALMEREFGSKFAKAILSKRPYGERLTENILDIANLPRTFLTAYDLSASMRQTYISGVRHPIKWSKAFKAQLKALKSKKAALDIQQGIRGSKYYESAVNNGLYLPDIESASVGLGARPEEFMSRFARRIPGVPASERAFITMGNKVRFELYSKYAKIWEGTGKTTADYKALANHLNAVTGRGRLGPFEKQGAALNALLFSPRYLTSRIQAVADVGQLIPGIGSTEVGKIAAGDMAAFIGTNLSVLTATKFFWGDDVDVELDPISSDFGKLRIGNSRFDLWAGYQPLMRYSAQILYGQQKSAITGKMSDVPRMDTLGRFVRSKLAPVPSFIVDLKTGTTFVGDEMTVAGLKKAPPENLVFQRFFPLAGQDIWDAFKYQGGEAAWLTVPAATLGIGVGAWELSPYKKLALQQDELANKYYGDKWDGLGPVAQKFITRLNPELKTLKQEAQYERTQFPFLAQQLESQIAAGKKVQANLPEKFQTEMERLKIGVGSLSPNIGTWQMSDERYQMYQDLLEDEITKQGGLITSESYEKTGDKFKRRRLENIIKNAKKRAKGQIKQAAIRKDTKRRKKLFE